VFKASLMVRSGWVAVPLDGKCVVLSESTWKGSNFGSVEKDGS